MQEVNHLSESVEEQRVKNQAAIALLDQWMTDASGYEEDNAEAIERALISLQNNPLALRESVSK